MNFTTIVTGLPRSGTSLVMQMLKAGGMPLLADLHRQPDEDNPRGYWELEGVKHLPTDPSVLDGSEGHAVKVIHFLIPYLPQDRPYRILFLHRNLTEVILSQQAMLNRQGAAAPQITSDRLASIYRAQLATTRQWLADRPAIKILELDHASLLSDSVTIVREIADFLAPAVDERAMDKVVDPKLYRQRIE
jgi:hypothetical protein